jgi:hypothetical protein
MGRSAKWGEAQAWALSAVHYTGDDCLLWPFKATTCGYGTMGVAGKTVKTHRYVCELASGSPPQSDMDCAHSCHVSLCCNPRHLRWATRAENEADKKANGTDNRGARHGKTTLTSDDVLAIRAARKSGFSTGEIARRYNVTPGSISNIMSGVSWAWLEGDRA